jgi:hypothetical protein
MMPMNEKQIRQMKSFTDRLKSVRILLTTVRSLLAFCGFEVPDITFSFDAYTSHLINEMRCRGRKTSLDLAKSYMIIGRALALGIPFTPTPWRKVIPGTEIPLALKPLVPLLQGSPFAKRLALSILNVYRMIHLPPTLDVSAITSTGPDVTDFATKFTEFVKQDKLFRDGVIKPDVQKQEEYGAYLSSKNGPNGPAVRNSHWDSLAMLRAPDKLRTAVERLLAISVPPAEYVYTEQRNELLKDPIVTKRIPILSKISMISEGGGKTRNVAIIDFWSQNALVWIHDVVMDILRKKKTDATYNQEDGFSRVIERANQTGYCASFDLTSATDRFPLAIQKEVVKLLFGEQIGNDWATVIADRDFVTPDGLIIRWEVGQPLGALSSWGVFALTHHFIVKYAAKDLFFTDYMILGDDLVILNKRVADAYRGILSEIGVTISERKTLVSLPDRPVFGEFAKRIFLGPDELTGLPPDLLLRARESLYMIPPLLEFLRRRWKLNFPGFELYVPGLFTFLTRKGQSHLSIILGFETIKEALTGYPWCIFSDDAVEWIKSYNAAAIQHMMAKLENTFMTGNRKRNEFIKSQILDELKVSEGDAVSNRILRWVSRTHHPVSLAGIIILGRLSAVQDKLFQITDAYIETVPVDHIPDPALGAMFYDRKTTRHRNHGQIVLKMFYERVSMHGRNLESQVNSGEKE